MKKITAALLFAFLLPTQLAAASVTPIYDATGNLIGLNNVEYRSPSFTTYSYNFEFVDLGQELVSFNDIFGDGPVAALQDFRNEPFTTQGVFNSSVGSALTIALQRLQSPNSDGSFNFPSVNTGNSLVRFLVLDSSSGTGAVSVRTSSAFSTNSGTVNRDQREANVSWAIVTSVTPVPLPAGFLLLGTAFAGLGIASRRRNSQKEG